MSVRCEYTGSAPSRAACAWMLLAAVLGAGTPGGNRASTARAAERARFNLLLITIDTTRADHLGCYGDAHAETPNLDRLASEGVRAERAISVAPLTLPAHASILTSLYPPRHGVRDNADYRLADSELTLAEHLKTQGYATAAVVGSIVLDGRLGLSQGFDTFDDLKPSAVSSRGGAEVFYQPLLERPAIAVTQAALAVLGRLQSRPFFLWVHYYDPHAPYAPPPAYAKRFAEAPYDGEIAYMDAQIGRLLDGLRQTRLLDRTLVVVTADHGESLGEHGEATHGLFVYDATVHVPLIARLPGVIPPKRLIGRILSGVDVVPTALELLSLPPLPGAQGVSFASEAAGVAGRGQATPQGLERGVGTGRAGRAAPASAGRNDEVREPVREQNGAPAKSGSSAGGAAPAEGTLARSAAGRAVYSESLLPERSYGWSALYAVRTSEATFIEAPDPELYDARQDPGERRNIAAAQPETAASYRRRLAALRAGFGTAPPASGQTMSAEERERLASLGYLSAAPGAPGMPGNPGGPANPGAPGNPGNSLDAGTGLPGRSERRPNGKDPKTLVFLHVALLEAKEKVASGNLAAARSRIARVLDADPGNPAALSLLGTVSFARGERDAGLARLQEAASMAPGVFENQKNLANALHLAGRLREAAVAYRAALALRPYSGEDHYALGNVLFAARDLPGAISEYKEAVRLGPVSAGLHAALGVALAAAGDNSRAQASLQKAVAADPLLAEAWNALGLLAEERGDWPGAFGRYERSLRAAPGGAEALLGHALASLRLGNRQGAESDERRLLSEHAGYPGSSFLRAKLRLAAGDTVAGRAALEEFLGQPHADARRATQARALLKSLGR